jgi:hypothetical protein
VRIDARLTSEAHEQLLLRHLEAEEPTVMPVFVPTCCERSARGSSSSTGAATMIRSDRHDVISSVNEASRAPVSLFARVQLLDGVELECASCAARRPCAIVGDGEDGVLGDRG